ncbi:unnamed protein product [Parajaminaea phylloscopi]
MRPPLALAVTGAATATWACPPSVIAASTLRRLRGRGTARQKASSADRVMVLFFESKAVEPAALIYMGKDKFENEDLIRYGFEEDVWFHVDKLSSAHVYLRMPEGMTWDQIPEPLLEDLGQLTKANSIQGNKLKNVSIIYTPWSNVKKTGDMETGTVTFHNQHKVRRHLIRDRENAIVNALNKTKREEIVDHEAVRQERLRVQCRAKKLVATAERNARLEVERAREADRSARDYSQLYSTEAIERSKRAKQIEAERARRIREERGEVVEEPEKGSGSDEDSDDSFM